MRKVSLSDNSSIENSDSKKRTKKKSTIKIKGMKVLDKSKKDVEEAVMYKNEQLKTKLIKGSISDNDSKFAIK
eukprot:3929254-Ditylum_brightwellii.AAC.1